jgi:hypothetical protein
MIQRSHPVFQKIPYLTTFLVYTWYLHQEMIHSILECHLVDSVAYQKEGSEYQYLQMTYDVFLWPVLIILDLKKKIDLDF